MPKKYKLAILIGRFQPVHNGHLQNFLHALDIAETVLVLVGSSYQPRTPKNPFTYGDRHTLICDAITDVRPDAKVITYPIRDFKYSNNNWIRQVQTTVKDIHDNDSEIAILGFDKDDSSWYNHAFPNWKFIPLKGFVEYGSNPIDATKVRELYFEGHLDYLTGAVPPRVFQFLKKFWHTNEYADLYEEYSFYKIYKQSWAAAPYPPTFVTTDAVVVQGGHVLLIERGFSPGKGLWALPGGFLNPRETMENGMIRELREETRLKVPEIVLRKGITYQKTFDAPDRDLRGRTVTNAFLIELDGGDGSLPAVKGADDAKKAKWFSLAEIELMGEQMYADHQHIIDIMVSRAKK